jgi:hypothetical protein
MARSGNPASTLGRLGILRTALLWIPAVGLLGCDLAQSAKQAAGEGTSQERGSESYDSQAASEALSLTVPDAPSEGPKIMTAWVRIARIPAHHKHMLSGEPGSVHARPGEPKEECLMLPPGPGPVPVNPDNPSAPPPSGNQPPPPPPNYDSKDREDKKLGLSGDVPTASDDTPVALPSDEEPRKHPDYPPSRGGRGWAPVLEMSVPYAPGQKLGPFALRGGPHVVVLELRDEKEQAVWRGSSVFVVRPGHVIKVDLVMQRARDCAGMGSVEIVPILSDRDPEDGTNEDTGGGQVGQPAPNPPPAVGGSYCEMVAKMMRPSPVCVSGGGSCRFEGDRRYEIRSECSSADARWKLIDRMCADRYPLSADIVSGFVCTP